MIFVSLLLFTNLAKKREKSIERKMSSKQKKASSTLSFVTVVFIPLIAIIIATTVYKTIDAGDSIQV